MNKIEIYGSKYLNTYSNSFLSEGFLKIGFKSEIYSFESDIKNSITRNREGLNYRIIQIHGASHSKFYGDLRNIENIKKWIENPDDVPTILLFHRPDEIMENYPELREILKKAKRKLGIVMLGDYFIKDDFYSGNEFIVKKVIPHGFRIERERMHRPIIIGSHTTWGEMRDISDVLKFLVNIFIKKRNREIKIYGYIGGKTINLKDGEKEKVDIEYLDRISKEIFPTVKIKFVDIKNRSYEEIMEKWGEEEYIVFVSNSKETILHPTINTQFYYLREKVLDDDFYFKKRRVRFGESSGSAHNIFAIPAIVEMNGADGGIENIPVYKMNYSDKDDFDTVNFERGAEEILLSITNGDYENKFEQFKKISTEWNMEKIAKMYFEFFEQLKEI